LTKEKKLKVPKRIAGVKVPKKIRKPVNQALAMAEDPAARGLAIAALTAAAAALTERRPIGEVLRATGPTRPGQPGTNAEQAGRFADVIIAAALDGASRLVDGAVASAAPQEPSADNDDKPKRRRAAPGGSGSKTA